MKSKLFLAAAIAALSLGAGVAQPANAGSVTLESGTAAKDAVVEQAKVKFYFGFGYPYYQPYYYSPYYAPHPYSGPYQYCHLGVCY